MPLVESSFFSIASTSLLTDGLVSPFPDDIHEVNSPNTSSALAFSTMPFISGVGSFKTSSRIILLTSLRKSGLVFTAPIAVSIAPDTASLISCGEASSPSGLRPKLAIQPLTLAFLNSAGATSNGRVETALCSLRELASSCCNLNSSVAFLSSVSKVGVALLAKSGLFWSFCSTNNPITAPPVRLMLDSTLTNGKSFWAACSTFLDPV